MPKKLEKQDAIDIIPAYAQTKVEISEDISDKAANLIFQIQDQSFKTAQTLVEARNFVRKIEDECEMLLRLVKDIQREYRTD